MNPKLLISDMDFTLLNDDNQIDPRNLSAIANHVAQGGLFTVASGRAAAAQRIFQELAPYINVPAIGGNGSQLFDFHTGVCISQAHLPLGACEIIPQMAIRFPLMGIATYHGDSGFTIHQENLYTKELVRREGRPADYQSFLHCQTPWQKVLMTGERPYLERVRRVLEPLVADFGRLVYSEEHFLELLCKDVSKGKALADLLVLINLDASQVVAIGDAPNDLEMLQLAGIGVAVANADPRVKAIANAQVGSHNDAAIAQCLETFFTYD